MPTKTNPEKLIIDIQFASPAIEQTLAKHVSLGLIKKWVKSATSQAGSLTLRFINLAEGKKLNAAFRNKPYATNVLTFPYEHTKNLVVADIIFCIPVLQKEAKEQGKPFKDHLAHLIIHGCLHAQGHDHEKERDAQKMEKLEIALLKNLGLPNPYLPI